MNLTKEAHVTLSATYRYGQRWTVINVSRPHRKKPERYTPGKISLASNKRLHNILNAQVWQQSFDIEGTDSLEVTNSYLHFKPEKKEKEIVMKEFLVIRELASTKFEQAMQQAFIDGWNAVFYAFTNELHDKNACNHYVAYLTREYPQD